MGCGSSGGGGGRQKPGTTRAVVQAGLRGKGDATCKELRASTGTCCVTGLQSKSRESQAGSPCMGTAFPFLRVAQCSGAGTCSRSRVGGLRRPALWSRTVESIRKRALARYCCLAHCGTSVREGEICFRGVAPPRPPGTPGRGEQGGAQPSGGVGASCQARGGAVTLYRPAWGGGESSPRGGWSPPLGSWGAIVSPEAGRTWLGGTGSPVQGVFGASCQAYGRPPLSENRAHRPGEDGESGPGGVRSLLPGQWGATFLRELGAPAWGGRGVLPRGCSEPPARPMGGHLLQRTGRTGPGGTGSPAKGVFRASYQANGGPSSSENRAHRPGGDGESCPGAVRSLLPGQWGAIFLRERGALAGGGRAVLPRGCTEPPARPMGGQYLRRTGRTGLGGMGSPAQELFGASCQANWGPSSSENRAHRPGGDWESCPGGVRSLLPGQWVAIFFREPGAPAWGGRGVLPRGCSEPPARPTEATFFR